MKKTSITDAIRSSLDKLQTEHVRSYGGAQVTGKIRAALDGEFLQEETRKRGEQLINAMLECCANRAISSCTGMVPELDDDKIRAEVIEVVLVSGAYLVDSFAQMNAAFMANLRDRVAETLSTVIVDTVVEMKGSRLTRAIAAADPDGQ